VSDRSIRWLQVDAPDEVTATGAVRYYTIGLFFPLSRSYRRSTQ